MRNKYLFNFSLLILLSILLITNQVVMAKNRQMAGMPSGDVFVKLTSALAAGSQGKLTGDLAKDAVKLALFQGVPEVYGNELGISFSQVEQAMNTMKQFDPTYGNKKIKLSGDLLQRYISIGLKISCEFCCGVAAIIRKDGEAACGCAHSQAMRGLAAYLLQNHASEFTDDEILRELSRWKGSYFPKAMVDKISSQLQSGEYSPDVAALLLELKVPKYSQSSKSAPLPSDINLPGQVGGC